jgi:hypothetical protein
MLTHLKSALAPMATKFLVECQVLFGAHTNLDLLLPVALMAALRSDFEVIAVGTDPAGLLL